MPGMFAGNHQVHDAGARPAARPRRGSVRHPRGGRTAIGVDSVWRFDAGLGEGRERRSCRRARTLAPPLGRGHAGWVAGATDDGDGAAPGRLVRQGRAHNRRPGAVHVPPGLRSPALCHNLLGAPDDAHAHSPGTSSPGASSDHDYRADTDALRAMRAPVGDHPASGPWCSAAPSPARRTPERSCSTRGTPPRSATGNGSPAAERRLLRRGSSRGPDRGAARPRGGERTGAAGAVGADAGHAGILREEGSQRDLLGDPTSWPCPSISGERPLGAHASEAAPRWRRGSRLVSLTPP